MVFIFLSEYSIEENVLFSWDDGRMGGCNVCSSAAAKHFQIPVKIESLNLNCANLRSTFSQIKCHKWRSVKPSHQFILLMGITWTLILDLFAELIIEIRIQLDVLPINWAGLLILAGHCGHCGHSLQPDSSYCQPK